MSNSMKDISPRLTFERDYREATLANLAANYGRKLFELNGTAHQREKLHILGDQLVVSEALFFKIKQEFPWERLRAFTSSEVVHAARVAGFTVYDSAYPSPYTNISPELDEYAIVWFEEDLASESAQQKQQANSTLIAQFKRLFSGNRVMLHTKFSAVYVEDKALAPHLSLYLSPPNQLHINPINLGSVVTRSVGYAGDIYESVLNQLNYSFPTVELSQNFCFVEQESLDQSSKTQQTYGVLNHLLGGKADGLYYLESEVPSRT